MCTMKPHLCGTHSGLPNDHQYLSNTTVDNILISMGSEPTPMKALKCQTLGAAVHVIVLVC